MADRLDVLVFYVPTPDADGVLAALFDAGAGRIGAYDSCAYRLRGTGQFRPLDGANPTIGAVGDLETVDEERCELVFPRTIRAQVVAALRRAHPYEEPAFHVLATADPDA